MRECLILIYCFMLFKQFRAAVYYALHITATLNRMFECIFSTTVCLLGVLVYPGKGTVVVVCVWTPTVSGVHPVGCGSGPVGLVCKCKLSVQDTQIEFMRVVILMIVIASLPS
jgi:hypothetical protein